MNESQTAPIVLVHGIFGFVQLTLGGLKVADYFRLIPDALRKDGHVVPTPPQLNPAGSVAERAQDLKNYLQNNSEVLDKKVHIVAHSYQFVEHLGIDVKAASDLTTDACRQFNLDVPDSPGIAYFSIAGKFEPPRTLKHPHGLLGLPHDLVSEREQSNDGLVSVQSATFAERSESWTSLDVWEANHFRLINWGNNILPSLLDLNDNTFVEKYRTLVTRVKELVGSR